MLFLLPTFNAALNPCPVGPAAFSPHEHGRFCGQCQRVVHDFSHAQDPLAALAAVRTASPDGRVCGSFRRSQVQAPAPALSRRLKWFVLALVLVIGQGLTAQEALAQVQKVTMKPTARSGSTELAKPKPRPMGGPEDLELLAPEKPEAEANVFTGYVYATEMPHLRDGGGTQAIVARIHARLQWPKQEDGKDLQVEGRMFASFTVEADGRISNVKTVKSLHPALDEAALEAIRGLTDLVPGRQDAKPVAISFTVPITFRLQQ